MALVPYKNHSNQKFSSHHDFHAHFLQSVFAKLEANPLNRMLGGLKSYGRYELLSGGN